MAAPLASVAPVPSPVSDVQRSDDSKPKCISSGDLFWIRNYASQCHGDVGTSPSVTQLQRVHEVLVRFKEMDSTEQSTGEAMKFGKLLPEVIRRTLGGNAASQKTNFQGFVLEVLCALVELAVTVLWGLLEDGLSTVGTGTSKLLEALSLALDPNRRYYELRRKTSRACMNVVLPLRLTSALEVPGFLVTVDGVADGNSHYFCSKTGVNHSGEACECCKPPVDADAVVVYLHWLLAKTSSGSGYECMLRILRSPKKHTLETVELLLRLLCQLLGFNTGSNTWREGYIRHVEVNCVTEFKNNCSNMCSQLLQYLNDVVPEMSPIPWPSSEPDNENVQLFSVVVNHLHIIACWRLSYYGSSPELDIFRDSLGKLQVIVCERLLHGKCRSRYACTYITKVIQATPAPLLVDNSGYERLNHPISSSSKFLILEMETGI